MTLFVGLLVAQEEEFDKKLKNARLEEERKRNELLRDIEKEREKMRAELEAAAAEHAKKLADLSAQLEAALKEVERLKESETMLNERVSTQIVQLDKSEAQISALEVYIEDVSRDFVCTGNHPCAKGFAGP